MGRFYWRKMFLKMNKIYLEKIAIKYKLRVSFAKAVLAFD